MTVGIGEGEAKLVVAFFQDNVDRDFALSRATCQQVVAELVGVAVEARAGQRVGIAKRLDAVALDAV